MSNKIDIEMDFENCPFQDISYEEYENNYREYVCTLIDDVCMFNNLCPLHCNYEIKE